MKLPTDSRERLIAKFIISVLFFGTFLATYNPEKFNQSLSVEDGFLEWMQFWFLVFTCVLLLGRVWRLRAQKPWYFLGMNALAAFAFFMVAGEEISWGQRIFNIESTQYFVQNNAQNEINLHNLVLEDGVKVNKILLNRIAPLFIVIYALVLPLLYTRKESVRKWCAFFGIPVPQLYQLGMIFLSVFLVEGLVQLTGNPSRKGELSEFALYGIAYLMVAYPQNPLDFNLAPRPENRDIHLTP